MQVRSDLSGGCGTGATDEPADERDADGLGVSASPSYDHPAKVRYSETTEVLADDGSSKVVPITDASKPVIPDQVRSSWHDVLASLEGEPGVLAAAVLCISRDEMWVYSCGAASEELFAEGMRFPLKTGSLGEKVIGADAPLDVPAADFAPATTSPAAASQAATASAAAPAAAATASWHGVPIHWSDGSFFGALCVLEEHPEDDEAAAKVGELIAKVLHGIEDDLEDLRVKHERRMTDDYAEAMDAMFRYAPGGIFSYSAESDDRFAFVSTNMLSLLGYTEDEFRSKFHNRFSYMVWYEDRERVLAEIDEQIHHGSFDTCEYRIERKDGSLAWVHDEGHIVTDQNGRRWFYVVIVDITDSMDVKRKLMVRNSELESEIRSQQETLDRVPGGIRVFKKDGGDIVCVNANSYYASKIGMKKADLIGETIEQCMARVHPDDRERYGKQVEEDLKRSGHSEGTYRFMNAMTKEYRWYHVEATRIAQEGGSDLAYFHYTDVDDVKRAEDELQEGKRRYELAVKGARIAVWEYDIALKRMIVPGGENGRFVREHYGFTGDTIENVPDCMLPLGVTDIDRENFLRLYDEVRSGKEYATTDVWFRKSPDTEPCCDHVTYYVMKDADGTPTIAYGVGTDVTAQKQEQFRFRQNIQSILTANPESLCTFQVNLTRDLCYEGHGASVFIKRSLQSDTASGLFDNCLKIINRPEDRDLFRSVFDRQKLLARFASGETSTHVDYRRMGETGDMLWARTFISMLRNPDSEDIEGVIYSLDVSREKRREEIFQIITGREYDLVALLDLTTLKVEAYHLSPELPDAYETVFDGTGATCDFLQMRLNGADTWVAPEYRRKYLEGTDPEFVRRNLDREGHYDLIVKGDIPDVGTIYRKLQHYYLDGEKRFVLIIDSDVTRSYLQQQQEIEERRRAQLGRTLADMVNSLPASSALFRILDNRSIIPYRYSDEFYHMSGYAQDDGQLFRGPFGWVDPEDVPQVKATISEHLDDVAPFNVVCRMIRKSGGQQPDVSMWVSVKISRVSFGDANYLYAVYTDVDDLKRQEQQLVEQYDAAQEYLDSVSSAYLLTGRANLSKNQVETSSNNSLIAHVDEHPSYDAYVEALLTVLPREADRARCGEDLARDSLVHAYERGERTRTVEFQLRKQSGELRRARITINLTKHPGTGDIIAFSSVRDVTEEELIKTIMDQVVSRQYDYISCIDAMRSKVVMFVSDNAVLNSLGIVAESDFKQAEEGYCNTYVIPADRSRYLEFISLKNIMAKLESGERCADSFTIDEGAGQRVKQVEFFYLDRESELIATLRMDITESQRRQLDQEEALRTALEAAQKANDAKSEFLSRMSHDMRTPLNGIIGMTYLSEQMEMSPEAHANLQKIDTSSKFLLGLINDILDMTKAESRKIVLHPEPYTSDEFLGYLDAVIKPLCADKRQTFLTDVVLPKDSVPVFDKLRINQVFFNLLSNAVKYTPEGGTITCYVRFGDDARVGSADAGTAGVSAAAGDAAATAHMVPVRMEIRDDGIGMSDGFQKILFEPFTQEDRVDTSEIRGTGLGLAIVKRLVEVMGGTVQVQSKVGEGTTFTVLMDVAVVPAAEVEQKPVRAATSDAPDALKGRHVLLCEDHPLNQEIAEAILMQKGMIVQIADNGQRGVEMFSQSPVGFYDVVLMDIRMPVMDGYQAARAIRSLPRPDAATVPVIAMTADAFSDDVDRCLEMGMDAHISKPIDPDHMFQVIRDALRDRK